LRRLSFCLLLLQQSASPTPASRRAMTTTAAMTQRRLPLSMTRLPWMEAWLKVL
jgi:hypothetical protein